MKSHSMLLATILAASVSPATEYWTRPELSGTSFDWTKKESYQTAYDFPDVPLDDPTTGDVICIHTNFVGKVAHGTASYDLLANCSHVKLQNGARFEIEVADAGTVAEWNSPVNNRIEGMWYTATIAKTGGGTLALKSCNRVSSDNGGNVYDYYANLSVEGGILKLPQSTANKTIYSSYYSLYVAEGCVLELGAYVNGTSGGFTEFIGTIAGEGMITNALADATVNLTIKGNPAVGYHSVFPGRIGGKVSVRPYESRVDLLNTGNTFSGSVQCEATSASRPAIIGAVDIGAAGGVPSSLGTSSLLTLNLHGGLMYLGVGPATTSKTLYCNDYGYIIDGGTNGGFTLTYPRLLDPNTDDRNRWIVFSGSNTVDCVYSGAFAEQQGVSHRIIKKGPGTWLFKHHSGRTNSGVIEVDDGTLKFESIAETNIVCSLGRSTTLFEKYFGAVDEQKRVGYAFQLGGIGTTGTMEYVGSEDAVCTTRKFALAGDGRLKASSGALDLSGFGTLNGADATLRLAGTGTGNVIRNLTNDAGRVTLVKEDGGTWTLDDEMSFKGDVRVKGGRLAVKRPDRYGWYRFILKENYYVYTNSFEGVSYEPANWLKQYFEFAELGLFDAEGNRCNLKLVKDTTYASTKTLAYGSYGYMNYDGSAATDGRTWADIFNEKGYGYAAQITSGKIPSLNDESSWPMVVMRLAEGSPPIASYDFVYSACLSNGDADWPATPCSWELQGSLDGKTWVSLSSVTHKTPPAWHSNWNVRYNGSTAFTAGAQHVGYEIAQPALKQVFDNVDTVGVAAGTLSTTDDVTIKGLSVDMDGAGTISGFAFAETGVLRVENCRSNDMLVLPGVYENVTGLANIEGWTLHVNDKPAPRRRIHVRGGSIAIGGIGMTISFK